MLSYQPKSQCGCSDEQLSLILSPDRRNNISEYNDCVTDRKPNYSSPYFSCLYAV